MPEILWNSISRIGVKNLSLITYPLEVVPVFNSIEWQKHLVSARFPLLLWLRSSNSVNYPWQSFSSKMKSLILSSYKTISDMLIWWKLSIEKMEDEVTAAYGGLI